MKKVLKISLFVIIANFVLTTVFFTWLSVSSIAPSLKESGISFSDLFKKNLSPEKKAKLDKSIMENSSALGKTAADKLFSAIKVLFPDTSIDYSKMPSQPYPYPSVSDVLDQNNKAADEGVAEGMKALEETEKRNQAIKDKALDDMQK